MGIPLRTVDTDLSVSGCPWWEEMCNFVGVWETAGLSSVCRVCARRAKVCECTQ